MSQGIFACLLMCLPGAPDDRLVAHWDVEESMGEAFGDRHPVIKKLKRKLPRAKDAKPIRPR